MSSYYRDVTDPASLLRRERDPLTGARVDRSSSKRSEQPVEEPQHARRPRRRSPRWIVAAGAAVLVLLGVGITWAAGRGDERGSAPDTSTTRTANASTIESQAAPETATLPAAAGVPGSAASDPSATGPAVLPVVPPPLTAATTAAPIAAPPLAVASGFIANTPQVITYASGVSASINGSYPVSIELRCTISGCVYPLRANQAGAVTADGSVLLTVDGDRIQASISAPRPCRGSKGTPFTRTIVTTLDLSFGEPVVSNGVPYPSTVTGTVTIDQPDIGFTPPLPRVDDGREIGCYRETIVIPITAALAPRLDQPIETSPS